MAIVLKTTCGQCDTTFQVKLDFAQRVGLKCNNCGSQVPASAVRSFIADEELSEDDAGSVFTLIHHGQTMNFVPRSILD